MITAGAQRVLLSTAALVLTCAIGGASAFAQGFEERLERAFGPDERREVLHQACLAAVGQITGYPPRVIRHRLQRLPNEETTQARILCHRMDALFIERIEQAAPEDEADYGRGELALACSALIRRSLESGQLKSLTPLRTMRRVCEKMTGRSVETPF